MGEEPDERSEPHSGWSAEDEPRGPSGPGNEPLVYERYLLDWEWKNYLGCLWIPALFLIIVMGQWLIQLGVTQGIVQLVALAAVFAVFLVFGLIDLSGYRWNWTRALIWLWLPGFFVLMIIATFATCKWRDHNCRSHRLRWDVLALRSIRRATGPLIRFGDLVRKDGLRVSASWLEHGRRQANPGLSHHRKALAGLG